MDIAIRFFIDFRSNESLCFFRCNILEIDRFRDIDIEIFPLEKWTKSSSSFRISFSLVVTNRCICLSLLFDELYSAISVDSMWILRTRNRDECLTPLHIGTISPLSDYEWLLLIRSDLFRKREESECIIEHDIIHSHSRREIRVAGLLIFPELIGSTDLDYRTEPTHADEYSPS